jgi:energy-coupling factor transporter ATP-binding protein EcfA2
MSYGLSGASGTGKSTLAKALAEKMHIHYLDASTTRLMAEFSFNPVGDGHSLDERITAQEYLLGAFVRMLRHAPRPFVCDRTPIDMAAYMLGEITMRNSTLAQGERVRKYVGDCMEALFHNFDAVLTVRPLGTYEAASTRPPRNPAYQWKIQYLIDGLIANIDEQDYTSIGAIIVKPLDERIEAASLFFGAQMKELMELRDAVGAH